MKKLLLSIVGAVTLTSVSWGQFTTPVAADPGNS